MGMGCTDWDRHVVQWRRPVLRFNRLCVCSPSGHFPNSDSDLQVLVFVLDTPLVSPLLVSVIDLLSLPRLLCDIIIIRLLGQVWAWHDEVTLAGSLLRCPFRCLHFSTGSSRNVTVCLSVFLRHVSTLSSRERPGLAAYCVLLLASDASHSSTKNKKINTFLIFGMSILPPVWRAC